jgi:hypothetical protein
MESGFHSDYPQSPDVEKAIAAAVQFLTKNLSDVERVDITEVRPVEGAEAAWEAEADVWQPNVEIKGLGLHTFRPVLEHNHYLVRLDAKLNVLEYEMHEMAH